MIDSTGRFNAAPVRAVLAVPRRPAVVAGLPAPVRAAHQLGSRGGVSEVLLVGAPDGFDGVWEQVLGKLPVRAVSEKELLALDPEAPVLVVASDGMPAGDGLRQFREEAARRGTRSAWVWKGQAVSVYEPHAGRGALETPAWERILSSALVDPDVLRLEAPDGAWLPLRTAVEVAAAERILTAGLSHGRDGWISQFDRQVSIPLSRQLARTRVTPNQITAVSIVVGLAGAALVASADRAACFLGTLLLWLSSILDGCDGEVARLKLLSSEAGRLFDLFGDYLVNLSTFAGIAWHVRRTRPDLSLGPLVVLVAVGVVLSGLSAWWLFLRKPGRQSQGLERTLQRFASRDFIYLVIPLAALGRLDWFLYGAAIGAHLFWIALVAVITKRALAAGG
jgi:phosphatidylglycerophosphate synthase